MRSIINAILAIIDEPLLTDNEFSRVRLSDVYSDENLYDEIYNILILRDASDEKLNRLYNYFFLLGARFPQRIRNLKEPEIKRIIIPGPMGERGPAGTPGLDGETGVVDATLPLVYNESTKSISITQADVDTDGFLTHNDWNIFNSKQGELKLKIITEDYSAKKTDSIIIAQDLTRDINITLPSTNSKPQHIVTIINESIFEVTILDKEENILYTLESNGDTITLVGYLGWHLINKFSL